MSRPLVIHVLTVADSLVFIDELVRRTLERGFEVTVVTSPDVRLDEFGRKLGVTTRAIAMPRRVTPLDDWAALEKLRDLFTRVSPRVVHAHTPKGGLLGSLAAAACQVPVRLYHLRGLPYVTQRGAMRALMQTTERLACSAATRVICHSPSLRSAALEARLTSTEKATVVLGGSNGVDALGRFNPARHVARRASLRAGWRLPTDAVVFSFVGRLVRDKGIPELVRAFEAVAAQRAEVFLVVAGPHEERDALAPETVEALHHHPRVRLLGMTRDTPAVYAASDVVILPSHREGFPNVPLEAAAMALPVITTRTAGCVDAVADQHTGTLIEVGDAEALAETMLRYAAEPALRRTHGQAGRERVLQSFQRDRIADAMVDLYSAELAGAKGSD